MRPDPRRISFAFLLVAFGTPALAGSNSQLHARMGMFQASYHGTAATSTGTISSVNSLEFDYEISAQPRRSFFFRANFTHDISNNQMLYSYAGGGMRQYLWGDGLPIDELDGGYRVVSTPGSRLFVGADVGISYVLLRVFGNSPLGAQSSLIEGGGHVGYIRRLSRKLGLEILGGASFGVGFSTVSVNALLFRGMVGLTYHFD